MSRRKSSQPRVLSPDTRYQSVLVEKFINMMMFDGKKAVSRTILYDALTQLSELAGKDALGVFTEAVEAIKPSKETKSRRVGGSNYPVPVQVRETRKLSLSIRWIIAAARKRSDHCMSQRLAKELFDAVNKRGGAYKKREEVYRMAEANKAFEHYHW